GTKPARSVLQGPRRNGFAAPARPRSRTGPGSADRRHPDAPGAFSTRACRVASGTSGINRGTAALENGTHMINVDYLMAAAREQLPNILTIYESFQEKKPVMLLDIQEERIYVYPYADFSRELSEQSQDSL